MAHNIKRFGQEVTAEPSSQKRFTARAFTQLPVLWSYIPNIVVVSCTGNVPQCEMGNHLGLKIDNPTWSQNQLKLKTSIWQNAGLFKVSDAAA